MKRKLSVVFEHHACAYFYNNLFLNGLQLQRNYSEKIFNINMPDKKQKIVMVNKLQAVLRESFLAH
jgi:hypothetical protein